MKKGGVGKKSWKGIKRPLMALVTPCVKFTAKKYAWKFSNKLVEELCRALYCKAVYNGGDSLECSLPPKLDHCWHDLILETQTWQKVQEKLGRTLHHTQQTAMDSVSDKNKRVDVTMYVYSREIGEEPDPIIWEKEKDRQLFLSALNGKPLTMRFSKNTTFNDVFSFLKNKGEPAEMMRINFNGHNYKFDTHGDMKLEDAGIRNESRLQTSGYLIGC